MERSRFTSNLEQASVVYRQQQWNWLIDKYFRYQAEMFHVQLHRNIRLYFSQYTEY